MSEDLRKEFDNLYERFIKLEDNFNVTSGVFADYTERITVIEGELRKVRRIIDTTVADLEDHQKQTAQNLQEVANSINDIIAVINKD